MGEIFDSLDQLARLTLEALLNSIWQGMLITVLVWLLLRMMGRVSATTRYAVWMISLLTISALPFIIFAAKSSGTADQGAIEQNNPESLKPIIATQGPPATLEAGRLVIREPDLIAGTRDAIAAGRVTSPDAAEQAPPDGHALAVTPPPAFDQPVATMTARSTESQNFWQRLSAKLLKGPAPMALICLWMSVVAMMLVRIARSYAFIFRLRQRLGFVPTRQRQRMHRLAEIFGIKRAVHLFTSEHVTMPLTVGTMRPMIILPPNLTNSLSDGEFDSIVAHELAHIKRWDYLTNLLQRIIQAFLFFHPAVWFIGKHLIIERELACDDWAVKTCEPRRYASCLTRLVELLNESKPRTAVRLAATGILFGKHVITRRVEMILNRERNATTAVSKPALLYAIGLALSFIIVCSLLSPVIAVPLGQKPGKQQSKKATKPGAAAQTKTPEGTLPPEPGVFPETVEIPEPPDLPTPPAIAGVEWDDDLIELPTPPAIAAPVIPEWAPLAPGAPLGAGAPLSPGAPRAFMAPQSPGVGTTITPRPVPAPFPVAALAEWEQDDKNKTPVIPETELLNVLLDIVKRDTDPTVRNEALAGIYRMRSDAAIDALIGLYDSMGDTKVKKEIIAYLIRRNGDNSKAIAKLVSIVKGEQNEELRNQAIRYLGAVKGDDGANTLIQIYDSLQDQKAKLYVIRSLGSNKSRKAVDKLIQIAKNDSDPAVRQSAIRSLYGIDNRLYLDLIERKPVRVGTVLNGSLFNGWSDDAPRYFQYDSKKWEEMQREWQEKHRELFKNIEKMRLDNFQFNQLRLDEMLKNLQLELPRIELQLKEIENGRIMDLRRLETGAVEGFLTQYKSLLADQLAKQRTSPGSTNQKVLETQKAIDSLEKQLAMVRQIQSRQPRPARATSIAAPPARVIGRASSN